LTIKKEIRQPPVERQVKLEERVIKLEETEAKKRTSEQTSEEDVITKISKFI
jgi:hypothetical protein